MLPSSSVHCNSSKCSHVLLHREHWSRNVDATSNFDHPFYKIFCICAHPFLFLSCHMEKDLFLTKVKPATPDMDFFPTFLLGTSPCHLTASHQNLRPPSFYYLTLCSLTWLIFHPLLKQAGTHTTKQSRAFSVFNVPVQRPWEYNPTYVSFIFHKILGTCCHHSLPLYTHSILKGLVLGSKINSCL